MSLKSSKKRSSRFANFDRAAVGRTEGHYGCISMTASARDSPRRERLPLALSVAELKCPLDAMIDRIVAAQQKDGYLHTGVTIGLRSSAGKTTVAVRLFMRFTCWLSD